MSDIEWTVSNWQVHTGQIQAQVYPSTAKATEDSNVTLHIELPSEDEKQKMLGSLSASAWSMYLLLNMESPSATTKDVDLMPKHVLQDVHEWSSTGEDLLLYTPYLKEQSTSAHLPVQQVESQWELQSPQVQAVIQKSIERLSANPLLAWQLAGWSPQMLSKDIFHIWGKHVSEQAQSEFALEDGTMAGQPFSDEPNLGSLLAEAATAGTLHQPGEGLAEIEAYLNQSSKKWNKQLEGATAKKIIPFVENKELQIPDIQALLPGVQGAGIGYQEVRKQVAERMMRSHFAK
ncbi:hypothetical protein PTI45_04198 [Paenibacillus nuruki]|uniref:Uncharacterized protein n=1 Tax=Paenibacillus nuruki TaxID=1886670 RepID=A0A1E3KXU0_9BACL|nr:hypothetical protein [Paenibacillus nuruki]ODP26358.1 hypothetical protein PTI45_04198 [Paenibacillus nuruki]